MAVSENINHINSVIPAHVKLIAVSKNQSIEKISEAYNAGHKIFGENKAQELISKHSLLPSDIEWHFIGHLQTNKVKYIVPLVKLIHSVESTKLLKEINKEAHKRNIVVNCLLQFHIATEESKYGLDYEEAVSLLNSHDYKQLNNIRICGVMGMATFTDNADIIRQEFKELKAIFDMLKERFYATDESFKEISMGMSDDYLLGIKEGSTMIRVGTAIFGKRV